MRGWYSPFHLEINGVLRTSRSGVRIPSPQRDYQQNIVAYKFEEKIKARKLRHKGESIKAIVKQLKVSKSAVSLWCRDIKLTSDQIERLHERMIKGGYAGRLKGARIQYERRIERMRKYKKIGAFLLPKFSDKDFLIAGAALYWGEGVKTNSRVGVSNSDPEVIKFMVHWFKRVWKVNQKRFRAHILINQIHKSRVNEVLDFWSGVVRIPKTQFNKTTLLKVKNKKVYKNFQNHYGTLMLKVTKPTLLHYQIMGLVEKMGKLGVRP